MNARVNHMSYRNGSRVCASTGPLPQAHAKLRVALVCLVWGEEFADFFARYCVRSLLEPHNIPRIAREQDVTLLVYTDRPTRVFLEGCDSFSDAIQVREGRVACARAAARDWRAPIIGSPGNTPWQDAAQTSIASSSSSRTASTRPAASAPSSMRWRSMTRSTTRCLRCAGRLLAVELRRAAPDDGHEYISFSSLQAVELFIRHVNPKHAAAACSGAFFINHPEYAIQLSPGSMVVSETGSHPFAVRSSTRCVSYVLDARSPGAKTCYLEFWASAQNRQ